MNEGTIGMIPHRRFHRTVFVAAGLYNIAWGLWSALDPQWRFRIASSNLRSPRHFRLPCHGDRPVRHPYLEVARSPEQGWLIAAVGLAGKMIRPRSVSVLIVRGVWPPSTIILCVTNDFIWWLPFGFYLNDSWTFFTRNFVPDQKDERVR